MNNGKGDGLGLDKAQLAHLSKYGVEIKDYAAHIFRDVLIFRRRAAPPGVTVKPGDKDFWTLWGVVSGMSPEAAAEFKRDLEGIPSPESQVPGFAPAKPEPGTRDQGPETGS